MEEQKNNQKGLIGAIVFAGLAIAGSVVFFTLQSNMSDDELADRITAGIEAYVAGANGQKEVNEKDLVKGQPFIGDEDAPVTIVEFSDYLCGYCQLFHVETWPQLKENYINKGKVKFVYRDFLLGYDGDYEAALVAECARDQEGDEAFFEMHDYLFSTVREGFDLERYVGFAEEMGLDGDELKECVEKEEFGDDILADSDYGRSVGVRGTPGFYVNGKFVPGALPYEDFEAMIEDTL